jgi:orotate phosphoribosyltransferase-like protein
MAYSLEIKNKAIELRKAGYSIKEIARTLTIAVSTSSIWLRKTPISSAGKNRMQKQSSINRYKMSIFWNKKRLKRLLFHQKKAQKILKQVILPNQL